MKNSGCAKWGFWALRLTAGIIFIYAGWQKLADMETTVGMFAQIGFPGAAFWAWLVALVEFIGGIALILGVAVHIFAALLAVTMLVATVVMLKQAPFAMSFAPIALLGSTIALFALGGGPRQIWKPRGCKGACCVDDKGGCGGSCEDKHGHGEKAETKDEGSCCGGGRCGSEK